MARTDGNGRRTRGLAGRHGGPGATWGAERGTVLLHLTVTLPLLVAVVAAGFAGVWFATARAALSDAARDGIRYGTVPRERAPCVFAPCPGDWPSGDEIEAHILANADDIESVEATTSGVANAEVRVTVRRRIPDTVRSIAGIVGMRDEVYSVTLTKRR